MPGAKRRSSGAKAALRVGPAIPLALALLHGAVSAPTPNEVSTSPGVVPVVCGEGIEDYQSCHSEYRTGCNSTGKYDAYLNEFKNRTSWANPQVQKWFTDLGAFQDLEKQLPNSLGKSNHADYVSELSTLGEGEIGGLMGYLYAVKAEGKESSNCQLDPGQNNENVDFHIYIGFDPAVAGRLQNKAATQADKPQMNPKSVIIEMTPHYRAQFHPEWTLSAVQAEVGRQVKITGQLMVDNEHYISSQDCGREDHTASCWRGTVWELHPVTDFQVCAKEPCEQVSGDWVPLGQNGVAAEENNPPRSRQSRGMAKR
jgi:hypothetical protein